jgi:plasmid stability protein
MKALEIPNLSDEVYANIEERARLEGKTASDVAAELISTAFSGDRVSQTDLEAEIRAEREQMAREGFWLTDESLREAREWGRK